MTNKKTFNQFRKKKQKITLGVTNLHKIISDNNHKIKILNRACASESDI